MSLEILFQASKLCQTANLHEIILYIIERYLLESNPCPTDCETGCDGTSPLGSSLRDSAGLDCNENQGAGSSLRNKIAVHFSFSKPKPTIK